MKRKLWLSFLCVSAILAGCTSAEDEPQPTPAPTPQEQTQEPQKPENEIKPVEEGVIDMNAVQAYKDGKSVATFNMSEYHIWDAPEHTGDWFEVFDAPHESMFPVLSIQEGKVWRYFHDKGNHLLTELHSAWIVYTSLPGNNENIYIATPFEFDEQSNSIELDGYTFAIVGFNSDSFKLGWKNRVNKQKKGWFDSYELYTYTKTEPIDFGNKTNTVMMSEEEACYYTYNKVRKYFGRYIDQRKYNILCCELDNPIIDLDYVKKCLDLNFGRNED